MLLRKSDIWMRSKYALPIRVLVILLFILFGTTVSGAQPLMDQPTIRDDALRPGETLEYSVKVKGIPAGTQTMRVKSRSSLDGNEVYHVEAKSSVNRLFNIIYPFDESSESYISKEGLYPLHYKKRIVDGKYKGSTTVDFDDDEKVARVIKDRKHKEIEIPKGIQDELSMIYLLRTKHMEIGREYEFDALIGTRASKVGVRILRVEELKTIFGTIRTIVIKAIPDDFTMWLTDNDARIPVKYEIGTKIGKLVAELKRMD